MLHLSQNVVVVQSQLELSYGRGKNQKNADLWQMVTVSPRIMVNNRIEINKFSLVKDKLGYAYLW